MAKKTKPAKPATQKASKKPEKKEKAPAKKYGITELSDALGIAPASARTKLRNHKIEKSGGRYGWDTKAEMDEVIDTIKSKKDDED